MTRSSMFYHETILWHHFHLPLHHMPDHKIYILPAATTPMKFLKILFARSFRYISCTPTHIFRRFYFAKQRVLLGFLCHKAPS